MNSTKLPRWPVPLLSGNNYRHPVSFDPDSFLKNMMGLVNKK